MFQVLRERLYINKIEGKEIEEDTLSRPVASTCMCEGKNTYTCMYTHPQTHTYTHIHQMIKYFAQKKNIFKNGQILMLPSQLE